MTIDDPPTAAMDEEEMFTAKIFSIGYFIERVLQRKGKEKK